MKAANMRNSSGNAVLNQFIITGQEYTQGVAESELSTAYEVFQSYDTIVCKIEYNNRGKHVTLDTEKWRYSCTTSRYRNIFLQETTKETQQKIDSSEYVLADLNN